MIGPPELFVVTVLVAWTAYWIGYFVVILVEKRKFKKEITEPCQEHHQAELRTDFSKLQSNKFSAYTHCGKCGSFDLHKMREPRVYKKPDTGNVYELDSYYLMRQMAIEAGNIDIQYQWAVIRICNSCGNEWGQK